MKTIDKYFNIIVLVLLILLFFRTCGSEDRAISKKIDRLSSEIDTLRFVSVTKKDLQLEGLKVEKRMIQSTDRKMLDVNRQSEIDIEIDKMNNE
jgi:hypothetical protein